MTKKQSTACGVLGLVLGVGGGIVGTAFSMGAEQQRVNDALTTHTVEINDMKDDVAVRELATQKERDRYADIIATQNIQLRESIAHLSDTVANLRTDVHVLKAIMERMEEDFKAKSYSN